MKGKTNKFHKVSSMLFVACDVPYDTTQVRSRRSAWLSQDLGRQSTTQSEFKWFCFYSPKVSELFNYAYFCWSFCRCLGVRWPWSVQVCADIGESVLSGDLGATHGTAFLPSLSWSRSSRYTSIVIRVQDHHQGIKETRSSALIRDDAFIRIRIVSEISPAESGY